MRRIKNVFLDRDGIINEVVFREAGISSPRSLSEFKIRSDFAEFYKRLSEDKQCNLFVFSNQPDIARGLLAEADLQAISEHMNERFRFLEIVYCRHDDSDECKCRKPKPGMLLYLLDKYGLAPDECIAIGDSHKDVLAAKAAGLRNILLAASYNEGRAIGADFTVSSLNDIFLLDLFI